MNRHPDLKGRLALTLGLVAAVILLVPATVTCAESHSENPNPYLKPDESWISISGTAIDTHADWFTLDYGTGLVTVEMDDWDWYKEGHKLLDGDEVIVYGRIDDDLYETTKIEASSVYVKNLGTYFHASAEDEEDVVDHDYWISAPTLVVGEVAARGTVTGVNGREFTIDTGSRKLTVDTVLMSYNPLDDKGFQKIEKGDRVSVVGRIDIDFWEKPDLMAESVVTLVDDSKRGS